MISKVLLLNRMMLLVMTMRKIYLDSKAHGSRIPGEEGEEGRYSHVKAILVCVAVKGLALSSLVWAKYWNQSVGLEQGSFSKSWSINSSSNYCLKNLASVPGNWRFQKFNIKNLPATQFNGKESVDKLFCSGWTVIRILDLVRANQGTWAINKRWKMEVPLPDTLMCQSKNWGTLGLASDVALIWFLYLWRGREEIWLPVATHIPINLLTIWIWR